MHTVEQIAREIVSREGGLVNDPDDLGGLTNWGVTLGTIISLGFDKNGDGAVNGKDVIALSKQDAVDIFVTHYFHKPRIGKLPRSIQSSVFDMYVNSGSNAIKILQRLLNNMGASLKVDGALGPKTESVAFQADRSGGVHFSDAYGIARRNYYFRIADKRPKNRKYVVRRNGGKAGWIKRAEEFISPKYHLSKAEFNQRIAGWS